MKVLLQIVIVICVIGSSFPAAMLLQADTPPDTLVNGSFDKWDTGMPAGWTVEAGAVEADAGAVSSFERIDGRKKGKYAIRLSGDAGTVRWSSFMQGPFAARPGDSWKLSGWMRTHDVRPEGHRYKNCQIFVIAFDQKGQRAGFWSGGTVTGTTDWSKREVVFQIPANAVTFKIGLFLSMSGRADFDDLSLELVALPKPESKDKAKD
jgi:hypothetical protein